MKDLSELDVLDLDKRKLQVHSDLISIPEAEKLFDIRCEHCDHQTGISGPMLRKAVVMGYVKAYNEWGSPRTKKGGRVYVIYEDVKEFIEKQQRVKARIRW